MAGINTGPSKEIMSQFGMNSPKNRILSNRMQMQPQTDANNSMKYRDPGPVIPSNGIVRPYMGNADINSNVPTQLSLINNMGQKVNPLISQGVNPNLPNISGLWNMYSRFR